jgi:uncharacterized Zn-binding protein involved in type VI secretion
LTAIVVHVVAFNKKLSDAYGGRMLDEQGREAARLGDTTDHGGRIVEAEPNLTVQGIPVALDGHMVECPRCSGRYAIIATGRRTYRGIRVAYLGDKTGCGAKLMRG